MKGSPINAIAGCFALAAFMVAIVAGLLADNPAGTILVRALIAMLFCYPMGFIVGMICNRVIERHDPAFTDHELAGELQPDILEVGDDESLVSEAVDDDGILTV